MPKPIKQRDDWVDYETDPEPEPKEASAEAKPEPEIRISKRTGKPVRPMTELQKETLAKGRALALQKKKELNEGVDKERKAEALRKAKEEMRKERDTKQQLKIASQKKAYEDALQDVLKEDEPPKKEKKPKKKVVKYVEVSSSDSESEEEEIIVRKKKRDDRVTRKERNTRAQQQEDADIPQQVLRQRLRSNLDEVKASSMAQLMMPSYF